MVGKILFGLTVAGGALYLWHHHETHERTLRDYFRPTPPPKAGRFDRLESGEFYNVLVGPKSPTAQWGSAIPGMFVDDLSKQGFVAQSTIPATAKGQYMLTGRFSGGQTAFQPTAVTDILAVQKVPVMGHNPVFP